MTGYLLKVTQCLMLLLAAIQVSTCVAAKEALDLATVDHFIRTQMRQQGIAGLALALIHKDQVIMVRGYGQAHPGVPVTAHTQFRLASLSKSFTALAVLQLVEAGKVDLDKPFSWYVPDFPHAMTVRQLLNHTSGLADIGFVAGLAGQQTTLAQRVVDLRHAQSVDPPGTAFHYFDPNYQLLARLVEVVSAQPFDTYLARHIFAPLAMGDTTSSLTAELGQRANHLAQGHLLLYGRPLAATELSGFLGGSGGVVSSASDMAHYLIAHNQGGQYAHQRVLSSGNIRLMQAPPTGVAGNYGMGWVASNVQGVRVVEHNGVLSTAYAEAVLLPDSGYAFVLLYNQYAFAATMVTFPALKHGLIALLGGHQPTRHSMTQPLLGWLLALATLLVVGLMLRSLLTLARCQARLSQQSGWNRVARLTGNFAPTLLMLALPYLLALSSGRYFDHLMLARAMPEVAILLGFCAFIGIIHAGAHIGSINQVRRV